MYLRDKQNKDAVHIFFYCAHSNHPIASDRRDTCTYVCKNNSWKRLIDSVLLGSFFTFLTLKNDHETLHLMMVALPCGYRSSFTLLFADR